MVWTLLLSLTGCGVWIGAGELPSSSSGGETAESTSDSGGLVCDGPTLKDFEAGGEGTTWSGQALHLTFDGPVPPAQLTVEVQARGGERWTDLPGLPWQLAGDLEHQLQPPDEGWTPGAAHDVTVRWAQGCRAEFTFQVGALGHAPAQQLHGSPTIVGTLSGGRAYPLTLGFDPQLLTSELALYLPDGWSESSPPEFGVSSGWRDGGLHPCGDRYGVAFEPGEAPVTVKGRFEKVAVDVSGAAARVDQGAAVLALGTTVIAMPRVILWLPAERLPQDACQRTVCQPCGDAQCGMVILEDVPARKEEAEILGSQYDCDESNPICNSYCSGPDRP